MKQQTSGIAHFDHETIGDWQVAIGNKKKENIKLNKLNESHSDSLLWIMAT